MEHHAEIFQYPTLPANARIWIEDREQICKVFVVNQMKIMYEVAHGLTSICGVDGDFVIEQTYLGMIATKKKVNECVINGH